MANVRGYTVRNAVNYLRTRTEHVQLSLELEEALKRMAADDWVSARYISELYCQVASLGKCEADAREELIKCGQETAHTATGTFMRRMLKMLPPLVFAKTLPSLWARDSDTGMFHVHVQGSKIHCRLTDMKALAHIAPISMGFCSFALGAMGKKVTALSLQGWSLETPYADEYEFDLEW